MNKTEKLLDILKANRLMKTPSEILAFESALEQLDQNINQEYLEQLHLILDDQCQQPEIMFGLIHFLESSDLESQIKAFITVVPQLIITAPEWTKIIHSRILNDKLACQSYHKTLSLVNQNKPHFLYQLLEESVTNQISKISVVV